MKKGAMVYVYDAMGQLAADYDGPAVAAVTEYPTADHLGSTRVLTDAGGAVVSRYDYLPFGEQITEGVNGRPASDGYPAAQNLSVLTQLFTGKERDAETGLDFFLARYYSSAQGRFTTPDEFKGGIVDPLTGQQVGQPGPLPYADITDPQTLNKYAYVRNNPMLYTDPDGHCGSFCTWWTTKISVFVSTHPNVERAINNATRSLGVKTTGGLGGDAQVGPVKLALAGSVSSEVREGSGNSVLQVTAGASINGVGPQINGTATFAKDGEFVNPLRADNLNGSAKLAGSSPVGDAANSNATVGTDGRVAVGAVMSAGIVRGGVQVTAGTEGISAVIRAVGDAIIRDIQQTLSAAKQVLSCGGKPCAE